MDPWSPINGITLERYAEISAAASATQDPAAQAEIAQRHGASRADWEAAKAGWTARMQDPSLMGQVAARYWPLYQAALARRNAPQPYPAQQQPYGAQQAGSDFGQALNAFGNAVGSFFDSAVGACSVGARVMVQWSDGHRYPAQVVAAQQGRVEVAFPDGRRVWVPIAYVSMIY
jgi:hypothetical protein